MLEDVWNDVTFDEISLAPSAASSIASEQQQQQHTSAAPSRRGAPLMIRLADTANLGGHAAIRNVPHTPRGRRYEEFVHLYANQLLTETNNDELAMREKLKLIDTKRFFATLSSGVTVLDLTYAYIGVVGANMLKEFFTVRPSSCIRELLLDCNDLGDRGIASIFTNFDPSSLEVLTLEVNQITSESVPVLSRVLRDAHVLRRFSASNNRIGDSAVVSLSRVLKGTRALSSVSFANVGLKAEGAGAVAALVAATPSLVTLTIMNNELQDEGIAALASAIQTPSCKLRECDLCNVGMTASAARIFMQSLKSNNALLRLIVGPNPLGDDGIQHVADLLAVNRTITVVDARKCNLTDEGGQKLVAALKSNTHSAVRSLHLDCNAFSPGGIAALRQLTASRNVRVTAENAIAVPYSSAKQQHQDAANGLATMGRMGTPQQRPASRSGAGNAPTPPAMVLSPQRQNHNNESNNVTPPPQQQPPIATRSDKKGGCCIVS